MEVYAIAGLPKVVHAILRPWVDLALVRVGTVAHRIKARVELVSRRRAHRGRGKGAVKANPLYGEAVDVWGLRLRASVATDIAPHEIVGKHEQQVRLRSWRSQFRRSGVHLSCGAEEQHRVPQGAANKATVERCS